MPTTDRTTIKAAIDSVVNATRANLLADPPTLAKPFRRVEPAVAGVHEYPRPFLTLQLAGTKLMATVDDDKIVEVAMTMRLVTDAIATDPHDAILDKMGAVDDYFDSLIDTGFIEGAAGFDDRSWKIEYPSASVGSRVATATATQTFVVKVERLQNRVPAP